MNYLFVLGRQPALGLAELESLHGAAAVNVCGPVAALVECAPEAIRFDRLGGSIKAAEVLTVLDVTEWRKIEANLIKLVPGLAAAIPAGKVQLGISAYGFSVGVSQLLATGLTLKKSFRKLDRSVRLVPNAELALNSASVFHNGLAAANGIELLIVRDGNRVVIGRTGAVQDIDAYTDRDRGRPKRDARVGMLPPKLAQIIINLAQPADSAIVCDPFCGTGVVLQEALLMGYSVYGSDLEPRMIEYTETNLEWLKNQLPDLASAVDVAGTSHIYLGVQDATQFETNNQIDSVACETYLGRPFTSLPTPEVLNQTVSDCNLIIRKFLRAIQPQLASGTRLCLAVPAWQVRNGEFKHLPLLDSLEELGYNRISFEHTRDIDLVYHRADQVVARELLVITKM